MSNKPPYILFCLVGCAIMAVAWCIPGRAETQAEEEQQSPQQEPERLVPRAGGT